MKIIFIVIVSSSCLFFLCRCRPLYVFILLPIKNQHFTVYRISSGLSCQNKPPNQIIFPFFPVCSSPPTIPVIYFGFFFFFHSPLTFFTLILSFPSLLLFFLPTFLLPFFLFFFLFHYYFNLFIAFFHPSIFNVCLLFFL